MQNRLSLHSIPKSFEHTPTTTARALFDGFFVHYGFPAKIHSDQGANFESRVIKKLQNSRHQEDTDDTISSHGERHV